MAADLIEGQSRTVGGQFNNVAIRQQTKLDQGLEAIADPKCQAIADEEQLADLVGNLGVSQSGSYEFTRAFRFVAAGKAAGQHQDLGPGDALCHRLQGLGNVVCGPVSDDEDLDLSTGVEEDFLGVVIRSWCLGKQGMKTRGLALPWLTWTADQSTGARVVRSG